MAIATTTRVTPGSRTANGSARPAAAKTSSSATPTATSSRTRARCWTSCASCSQPAAVLEEREHRHEQRQHRAEDDPERRDVALAGHSHVHSPDARDQRERQEHHAEHREDAQDVVQAVLDHRLVRLLECLHDLLVVLEHVPDALGGVHHVVEVELVVVGEEAALDLLEVAQHLSLRTDDLAEVDDLLLDVGDVAHDVLASLLLEDLLLDPVELVAHLAEHGEAVVDGVVDDLVEQVAGTLRDHHLAQLRAAA